MPSPGKRHLAKLAGEQRYFTGVPCLNGHVAFRQTSNGLCSECHNLVQRDRKAANVAAVARYVKKRPENRRVWWWEKRKMPKPTRAAPLRCECCGNKPSKTRSLALDHCHVTGKFRGWLCVRCNTGLGGLGDSIAGLQRGLAYLRRARR